MATTGSASVCLNQHSVLIPTQLKGVSLTSRISVPTRFYSNGFTSRIRASSAVAVEQVIFFIVLIILNESPSVTGKFVTT